MVATCVQEKKIEALSLNRGRILRQIRTKVLRPFLFAIHSHLYTTALSSDLHFFKLTQPLTVSTGQLLYTVKEKGGQPDRKPYPLPYGLRNPYRNLKSENSQDYAQKPQRNFTFMNSASGTIPLQVHKLMFTVSN